MRFRNTGDLRGNYVENLKRQNEMGIEGNLEPEVYIRSGETIFSLNTRTRHLTENDSVIFPSS